PRRQAAAQVLGLRAQVRQRGMADRVEARAVFVFATPYGLKPAPAVVEPIEAEVREIERALEAFRLARRLLADARKQVPTSLALLVDELPHNFQEGCYGSC